ncbi:MAG: TldD/PmbA family protein [Actinobacteria bacterium]|nr:TldD/PmbA family protein [Actinomycetota bacterium]
MDLSVIDTELAHDTVEYCLREGVSYSDIFCQHREVMQFRYEDGELDDVSFGVNAGAGVRVIKGDLVAYACTDVLSEESLRMAARTAVEAVVNSSSDKTFHITAEKREAPPVVCDKDAVSHRAEKVKEHLQSCDDAARSLGGEIKQVTLLHYSQAERGLFVSSLGEVREDECVRTRFIVQVVALRDDIMQMGMEAPGALAGMEFYEIIKPEKVALAAAGRALTMLDAGPAPAGRMPVVINSGTGGVLLHEACGHGLEADHVQKNESVYAGKTGNAVASADVSVIDNPTLKGLWGSYRYDDEGTPSQETVLIENGKLNGFLYSKFQAAKDGVPSTGNGRRESFRNAPVPRMSNTYLKPGSADPGSIIAGTGKGLYAHKMGGGQVDPTTGDFVFSVSEGYMIENGEVGKPVRGAVLIGNGPRTLEMIDAVGDDLSFEEGTCGKEGQGVPVCTGGPTFRVSEITVGGVEI